MATKASFNEDEWRVLQWAVTDTMTYISLADPGFWASFSEVTAAAKYLAAQRTSSENLLVRDLAGDVKTGRDKETFSNPADPAGEVAARISEAAALVAERDAEDLPAFKEFLLGLAAATAEATKGIADNEAQAIEKIRVALG